MGNLIYKTKSIKSQCLINLQNPICGLFFIKIIYDNSIFFEKIMISI